MGEAALLAGKYQTVRRLAVGGMGEVYLARESGRSGFSRLVVIKRMLPQFSRDRQFVEMFIDEARIIGNLHHPNICQILELGDDGGIPFLALEYVRGASLADIWDVADAKQRSIPRSVALRMLADTAWALHFAHEARDADGTPLNVIHRDISPHNVMVSFHGDVKLMDFGIARADNRQHRTDTGKIKGKISYMSPEQLRGGPLDRRSDVFAVGVMLWELTLEQRLFGGGSEVDTLQRAAACIVPRPRSIDPTYPEQLEAIVMNSLAREASNRTATAGELAEQLMEQVGLHGGCERSDVAAVLRELYPSESAMREDATGEPTTHEPWREAAQELHFRPTSPIDAPAPLDADRTGRPTAPLKSPQSPMAQVLAAAAPRPTAPMRRESPPEGRPTAPMRRESPPEGRPTAPLRAETDRAPLAPRDPQERSRITPTQHVPRTNGRTALVLATAALAIAGVTFAVVSTVWGTQKAKASSDIAPQRVAMASDAAPPTDAQPPIEQGQVAMVSGAAPPADAPRSLDSSPEHAMPAGEPQPVPTAKHVHHGSTKATVISESPREVSPMTPSTDRPAAVTAAQPPALPGTVAVSSTGIGVVVIDGVRRESTPFQTSLTPGAHELALELAEGAGTLRAHIQIEAGRKTKCKADHQVLACSVSR